MPWVLMAFNGLLVLEFVGTGFTPLLRHIAFFYSSAEIMDTFPTEPRTLLQLLRRLHDEPLDYATTLVEQFGPRGATSLGEAQAAAYFDGRLRRAGLKVSADAFVAPVWHGWDGTVLAVLLLASALLYRWQPFAALLFMLLGVVFAGVRLWRAGRPLLTEWRPSQNIIATRALAQKPTKRVVVLAPIDSPLQMPRWVRLIHDDNRSLVGSLIATLALLGLALIGVATSGLEPRYLFWLGQFVPVAWLLVSAGLDLWLRRAPATPGAVNHAGALAVLLACAETLTTAQQIELWVVAVGATRWGSGLADLLRRYPFEQGRTVFIALEGLGSGPLAYLTRTGLVLQHVADADLLAQAAAVDADDMLIDAEPRPYRQSLTTVGLLRQRGWRAIGIICLDADGQIPLRGSVADLPAALDADVLERAVRFVVGLVRRIDADAA